MRPFCCGQEPSAAPWSANTSDMAISGRTAAVAKGPAGGKSAAGSVNLVGHGAEDRVIRDETGIPILDSGGGEILSEWPPYIGETAAIEV